MTPNPQQDPNVSSYDPEQKKKTPLGWLLALLALLAALVIGLGLFFMNRDNNDDAQDTSGNTAASASASPSSSEEATSQASPSESAEASESASATASESASASATASSSAEKSGNASADKDVETREYNGSGNKVVEIEKPAGASDAAWFEYEFTGEKANSAITINSLTKNDDFTGLHAYVPGQNSSGSFWLDSDPIHTGETEKLEIIADGDWTIKVRSAEDAPTYSSGDTVEGTGPAAFHYEAEKATEVDVNYTSSMNNLGQFRLVAYDAQGESQQLFNRNVRTVDETVEFPASNQTIELNAVTGDWKLVLK